MAVMIAKLHVYVVVVYNFATRSTFSGGSACNHQPLMTFMAPEIKSVERLVIVSLRPHDLGFSMLAVT